MLKKLTYLFLVLVLMAAVLPAMGQSDAVVERLEDYNNNLPAGFGVLDSDALTTALIENPDLVLLDVRETPELEAGYIEGSIHIPIREIPANLDLLPDLDAEIVVVCQGGARAMLAQSALNVLGYDNAKTLKGGFGAWAGEDYPFVTDPLPEPTRGEAPAFDADVLAAVTDYLSNLPEGFDFVRAPGLAAELVETDITLIDVRTQDEWDNVGYIAGASLVPIQDFMSMQSALPEDKDAPVVVYCASSYRGGIAKTMMNLMGYTDVRNLVGGINAWLAEGLPVEGGAPAEEAMQEEGFDLVSLATDYVEGLPGSFNAVRVSELEAELAEGATPFLLDVRSIDEYVEGHIEGGVNVPIQELAQGLDLLPADMDADIVVYCGSGHRSALAMEALNLLGYSNARSLLGGQRAWLASELPITDVPTEVEAGEMPDVNGELLAAVDEYMSSLPAGYYTVRADDLNVELAESEIIIIDVRTQGERDGGYIEGSVHIPFAELMARMDEWPEDMSASIVVYGNPTHRSSMAMMLMQLFGYEDVRTLAGGAGGWENAGLPLVTD